MDEDEIEDFTDDLDLIGGDNEDLEHFESEAVETVERDEQNGSNDEEDKEKKEVKPKKKVQNPRFTLNAELLKGPKGLGMLERCFEKVKFKGKGHEEEDLNVLLKTYEYWCHRLYPKFPFLECVQKIEKLGSKGPIQTYLKKVRSGMIDDETAPDSAALPEFRSDEEDEVEPATDSQRMIEDIPVELTEEQLETIRKNREKAELLRQERLKKIQEKAATNLPESMNTQATNLSQPGTSDQNSNEGEIEEVFELSSSKQKTTRKFLDDSDEDEPETEDKTTFLSQPSTSNQNSNEGEIDEVLELSSSKQKTSRKFLDDSDEDQPENVDKTTTVLSQPSTSNQNSNEDEIENVFETSSSKRKTTRKFLDDSDEDEVKLQETQEKTQDGNGYSLDNPPEAMDVDEANGHEMVLGEISESPNKFVKDDRSRRLSTISEGGDLKLKKLSLNGVDKENLEEISELRTDDF